MVLVQESHLKLYFVYVSKQKSLYIYKNKKLLYIPVSVVRKGTNAI